MKKVIEVVRVSTERQARSDRTGIPAQRAANRHTAEIYGLEIVETVELINVSGLRVLYHPEIHRLVQRIQSPDISGVVVRDFSRVMRPECFGDFAFFHVLQQTGTVLYLPDGPIDLATKLGRLNVNICAAFAGLERTEAAERVWAGKEELRKAGKHPIGDHLVPTGVGYERSQGKWFYTPEAQKVKMAFRLILRGEANYGAIAHQSGLPHGSIRCILRNPIYCGLRIIDRRRDPTPSSLKPGKNGRNPRRPSINRASADIIRVRVISKPLIAERDFTRVQQLMDIRRQREYRVHAKFERFNAYKAFLMCGDCGAPFLFYRTPAYYVCSRRSLKLGCKAPLQRCEPANRIVEELFGHTIVSRGFIKKLLVAFKTAGEQTHAVVEKLQSKLRELEQKRLRVFDLRVENAITGSKALEYLRAIQVDVERCMAALLREPAALTGPADRLAKAVSSFKRWKSLRLDQKRRLLASAATLIYLDDYKVSGISILGDTGRIELTHSSLTSRDLSPFRPGLGLDILHIPLPTN